MFPVLIPGTLKAKMPVEQAPTANRRAVSHLEAIGRLLAGTMHLPWAHGVERPAAPREEDVQRFLDDLNAAIPGLCARREHVLRVFAGLLPATAEGTARQFADYLKNAMSRTLFARLGYLLARGAFRMLRDKMDPRKSNGGVFLGLNGVVIKSHGGADAEGFAAAIDMGYDMVRYELLAKIGETIHHHAQTTVAPRAIGGAAL